MKTEKEKQKDNNVDGSLLWMCFIILGTLFIGLFGIIIIIGWVLE